MLVNHLLGVLAGTGKNVLIVEKIVAAVTAKEARGKASRLRSLHAMPHWGVLDTWTGTTVGFQRITSHNFETIGETGCFVLLVK
jgi:hypothetical protein